MSVLRLPPGMKPTVSPIDDGIAIWGTEAGEETVIALGHDAAVEVALNILAVSSAATNRPTMLRITRGATKLALNPTEDRAAALVLHSEGGEILIEMGAMQIAHLAAALADISRTIG